MATQPHMTDSDSRRESEPPGFGGGGAPEKLLFKAHSGIVRSGPNGCSVSVPRGSAGGGGARGEVRGWSRKAAARHVRWLHSVDAGALDGHGYAVTLTVRDLPTSDEWSCLRQRFARSVRARGAVRSHWVTEWQARGVPHLHFALFFPDALDTSTQFGLIADWLAAAKKFGATALGQDIRELQGDGVGWAKYQAKHSARSQAHYQRGTMPPSWEKSGRLWGHTGNWPTREDKYVISGAGYYPLRRLIRSHALADARSELDPKRRARRLRGIKQLLKGNTSALRGAREWVPEHTLRRMLDWVAANYGTVLLLDEPEAANNPPQGPP